MQVIYLLEADYNWLNKSVFAKHMMSKAYKDKIVPIEQVAPDFFCGIVRTLHCTAGLGSVDLVNCYDAVAHPITVIALQSFRVRIGMVAMTTSFFVPSLVNQQ